MTDLPVTASRTLSDEMVNSWRLMMTVLARTMNVKLGLVTRSTEGGVEITAPSLNQTFYEPGDRHTRDEGPLCEYVITNEAELVVADSRSETEWLDNPNARLGLLAYLGFPVYWPDGQVFGTICVLDDAPRDFTQADLRLLLSARDVIHDVLGAAHHPIAFPGGEQGNGLRAPTGLWDYDPWNDRVRLSASIRRIHGLPDAESLTLTQWLRCFPEGQRSSVADAINSIRHGRAQSTSVAVLVPGLDSNMLIRITARGIRYESGRVISIVGTHSAGSGTTALSPVDPFFAREPLTGLPTRSELEFRVQRALDWHRRVGSGAQVVMSIVEVENAGELVRRDGIDEVDTLMIEVAESLRGADRFVAALGFGYFAVLVSARADTAGAAAVHLESALRTDLSALPLSAAEPDQPGIAIATVDVAEIGTRLPSDVIGEVTRRLRSGSRSPLPRPARLAVSPLTARQKEIARLVAQGLSNREVAKALVITVRTVEGHLDGIRIKLGVGSRTQLVALVLTHPELVA